MNEIYTPFFDATCNVFALMLDLSDITQKPAKAFQSDDALTICVGVVGDLVGEVRYGFPGGTSLSMVTIMSGMEMDVVDDFVTSAISEIANIISGNVLTILAARELNCDLLPPVLCEDDGRAEDFRFREVYCLDTGAGMVSLEIRLNPAQSVTV